MSSRLALLAVLVVGCTDEPEVIMVTARASDAVSIGPAQDEGVSDDVSFRWDLALKPDASALASLEGESTVTFTADVRGMYVLDRWLSYGLSERMTHHFVVDVVGLPPESVIASPIPATVGTAAMLDGAASSSPEGLGLLYRWRLAARPRDSTTMLATADASSTSFVPDRAGEYVVELTVFDGELWSTPSTAIVTAQ